MDLIARCVNFLKNIRSCILIIFVISGCAASTPNLLSSGKADDKSGGKGLVTSNADMVLTKIELLLKHARLDDDAYISRVLDVRLVGGELESGRGDMIYACALPSYTDARIWKGRRYRYDSEPAYLAPQPFPATSKCYNPYVIDEKNPMHIAASLSINLNIKYVCIKLADVKMHFKDAYYSESRGGFGVRYRTGDMNNHIVMRIESTRAGEICVNTVVLDQNDFSPEIF
ncbi:hypothetical protein [Paraburkholderia phenazinium]|uniref:Lipoprotein n=1 Tax=Paraburkholderia phenazinium TaxID=60549 RepID=A0A1N6LEU9_9BURK|nr:hypothetical protein [Paraburkholderia phenazinium]SIO67352.1 hypothetical protein SAMN05444165_7026 [Paraburkholderia phenazinium]